MDSNHHNISPSPLSVGYAMPGRLCAYSLADTAQSGWDGVGRREVPSVNLVKEMLCPIKRRRCGSSSGHAKRGAVRKRKGLQGDAQRESERGESSLSEAVV
jgi:hypothetical protein